MSEPEPGDPTSTWIEVVALLSAAANTATTGRPMEPDQHSLALGALIVAARSLELLPGTVDREVDVVVGTNAGLADHIRAAQRAARRHPTEAYPMGAAAVIAELDTLAAEAEALS